MSRLRYMAALLFPAFAVCTASDKLAPTEERLQRCLRKWEQATDAIQTLQCKVDWVREEPIFLPKKKKIGRGEVRFVRPDVLRVDWSDESGPATVSLWHKDRFCFHDLAKPEGVSFRVPLHLDCQNWPPTFEFVDRKLVFYPRAAFIELALRRWAYFGMPVGELLRSFEPRLAKGDAHYDCLDFEPRNREVGGVARRIWVALERETHLPRRIVLVAANGDREMWTFERPVVNGTPPPNPGTLLQGLPRCVSLDDDLPVPPTR